MDDLTLIMIVTVVLMCATAWLLVAYLMSQKALKQRDHEIQVLTRVGSALYRYVKTDLASGKTAFSFTGHIRPFEVWRNENLDRAARPLVRAWEERHTHSEDSDPRLITLPEAMPLNPSSTDAVARASMEYQPKIPEAWRQVGTETGRGHSEGLQEEDFQ